MENARLRILSLLKELSEAYGPPGYEDEVREIMIRELEGVADEVRVDKLGNVIAVHEGSGPKVMLSAHMDEVALLITHIDDKGFLRFFNLGGIDPRTLYGQRVMIKTDKGVVYGYIGAKPPHLLKPEERKTVPDVDQLFIDVGVSSREEVKNLGVKIGSLAVFATNLVDLGNNRVLGKAFDDRAGCTVLIEVMRLLKDSPYTVYGVATVQEEVGLRGARTAAWQIEPDVALALEGTTASDTPGTPDHLASTKVGGGPAITIADNTLIAHPKVVKLLVEVAERLGIPYQFKQTISGGTDAGAIHVSKSGVPSGVVSVPTRYIHSAASLLDLRDLENAIELVKGFVDALGNLE
ncbi:MAG: M42 family metallopeptidase [Candidatus Baldrarchaeia archaeon]